MSGAGCREVRRLDRRDTEIPAVPRVGKLVPWLMWALAAPTAAQQVRLGGQVRPRYESRDAGGQPRDAFTTTRVRADLTAALDRGIGAFIQVQGVRLWGEQASTVADARTADFGLHQGYVELTTGASSSISARVGRQELSFAEERLMGALDWSQQARAFDGVRVSVRGSSGTVDLFGAKLADPSAPGVLNDAEFAGGYAQFSGIGGHALDLYALYQRVAGVGTREATLGGRAVGKPGSGEYRLEGAYQLGERQGRRVEAFLLAARLTGYVAAGRGGVTLWYDYLSGDEAPGTGVNHAFNTLFATNHKFYGIADLFTDIPVHTGGHGLQDAALKLALAPVKELQLTLDGHAFRLARRGALSSAHLGEELDLAASWRYGANLVLSGGLGLVRDGPALRSLGRLDGDLAFTYLMLDARF